MREDIATWRRGRYFKVSLALGAACVLLYVSQYGGLAQPPNGGTWQGYALGTVGALLVLTLSFLGIRKRLYASRLGSVQGWTSAHVYLGTTLLLIATLHCAGQFGWNVHTLAYVLTVLVITSGLFGLYQYRHLPRRIADNADDRTRQEWLEQAEELDRRILAVVSGCDASLHAMVLSALDRTRIGGSVLAQLSARDLSTVAVTSGGRASIALVSNCDQATVIGELARRIPNARIVAEAEAINELLALFGRRCVVLRTLRRDIRLKGLLKIWLYLHVPLTTALLVALSVHILTTFIYW